MLPQSQILTLLRSGALVQAEKAYRQLGLDQDRSSEDAMALGGRILKARALEETGAARQKLACAAADKYAEAYAATGGSYSGINMAALYHVAGDRARAAKTARAVLAALESHRPKPGLGAYYHMATQAEAMLILGDQSQADLRFADAAALAPHEYDAHASTLKQFEMLIGATGGDTSWLDPHRPPCSLHFAGHMWGLGDGHAPLAQTNIYALERSVSDALDTLSPGEAFGALAAGSDILIAEQLLDRGVPLHVIQPCPHTLFRRQSLDPFGTGWNQRFEDCLARAASIRTISHDPTLADDLTTAFASETAMGLSVLRAERLATRARQLLIWDKQAATAAGTGHDAALWAQTGRHQQVIPFPSDQRPHAPLVHEGHGPERSLQAMLFADVSGFGRMSEAQVPRFLAHVLEPLAACCAALGVTPKHVNTWGDGLFLVYDIVGAAADAAIALQDCFQAIDLPGAGLQDDLALRVAGHYAPVHLLRDPFLARAGVFGREVTTAARMEPVTPPGSTYVSEPFACALALAGRPDVRCEPMPATIECRDRGALTLFSLRRCGIKQPGG